MNNHLKISSTPSRKKSNRLARRLAFFIIITSTIITIITSAIQLMFDYSHDIKSVEESFETIKQSHAPAIAGSLWNYDYKLSQILINGIASIPQIEYVELIIIDKSNNKTLIAGDLKSRNLIKREISIDKINGKNLTQTLAALHLYASRDNILAHLFNKALIILITNAFKTFLVAGYILLMFSYLVTRHLNKLAHFARSLDIDNKEGLQTEFQFDRKANNKQDELDDVIIAFNDMHKNLLHSLTTIEKDKTELIRLNNGLEQHVEYRTNELSIAKDRAEENKKRLQLILDSADEGIYGLDMEGHCTFVNQATADMLGYEIYELLEQSLHDLIQHSHSDGTPYPHEDCPIYGTLKNGKVNHINNEYFWCKDGSLLPVEYNSKPIIDSGIIKGAVVTFKDITEQKLTAELLVKAKEQAESANQAKSRFLANMSHEIRTPMNSVLGFTELLQKRLKNPIDKSYLESIDTSGRSLLRLINDILDISKVEAGKFELEYTTVNPRVLVNEMKIIFSQKMSQKGLDFIIDIDNDLPQALTLDESRLRQVLFNLVGNALKFTSEGFIRLVAGLHDHKGKEGCISLCFSIEDSGPGIPEENREEIFGAFEQQVGQSFAKFGGTGLGLAISKKLAKLMNGDIFVDEGAQGGATFKLILHDVEVPESAPEVVDAKKVRDIVSFKGAKIHIIDNTDKSRELLVHYLSEYDVVTMQAENGRDGLDLVRSNPPDLILLDMRMPVMDGFEFARAMKAEEKLNHIPIIAVTASAMKEAEGKARSICDGYLRKPINKNQLLEEIGRFLDCDRKEVAPVSETPVEEREKTNVIIPEELREQLRAQALPIINQYLTVPATDVLNKIIDILKSLDVESAYIKTLTQTLEEASYIFDLDAIEKTLREAKKEWGR